MRNLLIGDILLLFFSIYVGIFFKKFHTAYPKMRVGFHIWEVCYNKDCWEYGNNFAGNISIIIGVILFGSYNLFLYFKIKRSLCVILLITFTILYFILLLLIVRYHMRKKFNLKDEKKDED